MIWQHRSRMERTSFGHILRAPATQNRRALREPISAAVTCPRATHTDPPAKLPKDRDFDARRCPVFRTEPAARSP